MTKDSVSSILDDWLGLVSGCALFALAALAVVRWFNTGTLEFRIYRVGQITTTGPVAIFATILCGVLGPILIVRTIRRIRRRW